jgi:hypothetical protein
MDVGHGFFMVKFDHEMDRLKIVNGVLEVEGGIYKDLY